MKKIVIIGVVLLGGLYSCDNRDMEAVNAAQVESIKEKATEVFDENKDDFLDDADIVADEIAPLALDTTKAEK